MIYLTKVGKSESELFGCELTSFGGFSCRYVDLPLKMMVLDDSCYVVLNLARYSLKEQMCVSQDDPQQQFSSDITGQREACI